MEEVEVEMEMEIALIELLGSTEIVWLLVISARHGAKSQQNV